jgi:hypothetical protein
MRSREPWEDPNYFAGFKDLFFADQIWISDVSFFPFRMNSIITDEITSHFFTNLKNDASQKNYTCNYQNVGTAALYDVKGKDEKRLYIIRKRPNFCHTSIKTLLDPILSCGCVIREGFVLTILNVSSTPLVQFVRRSHFCPNQRDVCRFVSMNCARHILVYDMIPI